MLASMRAPVQRDKSFVMSPILFNYTFNRIQYELNTVFFGLRTYDTFLTIFYTPFFSPFFFLRKKKKKKNPLQSNGNQFLYCQSLISVVCL